MIGIADLPALNATLNATSALFLAVGLLFIRARRIRAHRFCMWTAFAISSLFLVSYVVYHANAGSRHFTGQGWIRPVYFALLLSHVVLAATVPPLALVTLRRGERGDVARHRRIARIAWPIWMYVSVTGVLVYLMLYRFFPTA